MGTLDAVTCAELARWTPCPFPPCPSRLSPLVVPPEPHSRAAKLPLRMPGADRVLCWHKACESLVISLARQPASEAWFSLTLIIPSIDGVGPIVNLQIAGLGKVRLCRPGNS